MTISVQSMGLKSCRGVQGLAFFCAAGFGLAVVSAFGSGSDAGSDLGSGSALGEDSGSGSLAGGCESGKGMENILLKETVQSKAKTKLEYEKTTN